MSISNLILSCNSWNDFQKALIQLNKKEKGNAFEFLTKLYFKVNPVYTFYDDVWLLHEVPTQILEHIGIPSHDLGIDLIAKYGEEYHAIQCKFHSDLNSSVSFKEVATFISLLEGNKKFTQGYICSSANITSRNFDKIETKPITSLLADTWQTLDATFFDNARKFLHKEKLTLTPFKPKPHQTNALIQAEKYFIEENNSRGKLIFPCGAGKSLTGFWLTQSLKAKATLIAVPSLSLVKQTLDVYLREIVANNKKVKWLCICSDEGIGKEEDIVFKTENLGVPCQTNPEYIQNWLKKNKEEDIIIFTTYQSGRIIAEVSKALDFTFDVAIFDEAHKTVGSNKKLFSHLLFEENIAINKRIYMTATERFYVGSKDEIISMDDTEIYGDIFSQMSFKEAIDLELLTDYKVITIDVKKSEIAEFIKSNNLLQLNDKWKNETEARSLASMLALRKAMKLFPIKNAVSFHSSIEKATRNKELQKYITDTYHYSPIDTFTVSGKMPTTKRNIIVQEFANSSNALITNARCLTEGVDVPNIDCIVFSDPRKSKVDIVQALGRALRKKEGKDWGYVILPVVYDDVTQEIDNENFNEILAIVRGLASNDDRIIEFFKSKNETTPRAKKENTSQFNLEVFSEYMDANELANQLQIKLWEKLSRFEWMPFEEAREFVRGLSLKNQNEWNLYCKSIEKPNYIPTNPYAVYDNKGWISLPDFLGYDGLFREVLPYEKAREYVITLKLNNAKEWINYSKTNKLPTNIPKRPESVYKNKGWCGIRYWLGKDEQVVKFISFLEAKEFVKGLQLKSSSEWLNFTKSENFPKNIPKYPNQKYKNDGWTSWGDFLGTGKISDNKREYLEFNMAKEYVKNLNLNNSLEWKRYCISGKIPTYIPKKPEKTYKEKGWIDIYDWLGVKKHRFNQINRLSYIEAKKIVQSCNLKNWKQWKEFCKSETFPINIPKNPNKVYKDEGWINWGEWLGSKNISTSKLTFLGFEESKQEVLKYNLNSSNEWKEFCKTDLRPLNLPINPNKVYKDNWISWGDWLGTFKIANQLKQFITFKEAKNFVLKLGLRNEKEWRIWKKRGLLPPNIPAKPEVTYKDSGWKGYVDFLRNE